MYALIFDVDGVLGDTEGPVCRATMAMFEELYDCTMKLEDFLPFVGTGAVRYVEGPAEQYGLEINLEAALQRRHDNFVKIITEENIGFPGATALIEAVASLDDWKLGIATSSPGEKSRQTLRAAGVNAELFDVYIHGDMISNLKPDPEIYNTAGKALDIAPERCVVIEDAVTGVASAKAAGMAVIAVLHTFSETELAAADKIVPKIGDITLPMLYELVGADAGHL